MVVHYPRTVWKNSYAEHKVTGKTYNLKKNENKHGMDFTHCMTARSNIPYLVVDDEAGSGI